MIFFILNTSRIGGMYPICCGFKSNLKIYRHHKVKINFSFYGSPIITNLT